MYRALTRDRVNLPLGAMSSETTAFSPIMIYIHTYVRTYVHTYIYTYIHTYIRFSNRQEVFVEIASRYSSIWNRHVFLKHDRRVFFQNTIDAFFQNTIDTVSDRVFERSITRHAPSTFVRRVRRILEELAKTTWSKHRGGPSRMRIIKQNRPGREQPAPSRIRTAR